MSSKTPVRSSLKVKNAGLSKKAIKDPKVRRVLSRMYSQAMGEFRFESGDEAVHSHCCRRSSPRWRRSKPQHLVSRTPN